MSKREVSREQIHVPVLSLDFKAGSKSHRSPNPVLKPALILETIMRTYVVQNVNMNAVGVQSADFVIQPDLRNFEITEFSRADEMSSIGAETTLDMLPQLKQLLSRVDSQLFFRRVVLRPRPSQKDKMEALVVKTLMEIFHPKDFDRRPARLYQLDFLANCSKG